MDINLKYTTLLKEQIATVKKECRYLEFKSNYQEPDKLGKYISALSNGACLEHKDFAYLYFGIDDETLQAKGTTFDATRINAVGNEALELYLRRMIIPKINFSIEEFLYEGHTRMVVLKKPAAVNEPTTYKQKAYVRVDSHVTELTPYVDWMRQIYTSQTDWSAQIIEDASIEDLDPEAILLARAGYKLRYPDFSEAIETWDDATFLDKAHLTQDGQITRTALLLVGKPEKLYKLNHIAQIVWKCFQDGETFGDIYTIPYIRATTNLMNRIRNYRFKIYPQDSLIPAEVWKYDTRSILEGLHNCIAHQNFLSNERIVVTEDKDKLTFENAGGFLEGDYTQYILGTKTPKIYRNPFLMRAMVNLKMIDSQGYGIHNLFVRQKERFLPMPDYNGTDDSHVIMHIYGTVIDENYSLQLFTNQSLSLMEAVLLDQVQRDRPISDDAIKELRKKHLIEGRKPHLFVAKHIAQRTDKKVEYSMHKGLNYKSCESLLVNSLKDHGQLKRGEIDKLLWNVISDQLDETQKKTRIGYILRKLHSDGIINNETKGNVSYWSLTK